MNKKRLFVIGLDAADKELIDRWVREGVLPTFQRLLEKALWGDVENPPGLEAGSCWPSFGHGLGPANTGQFDGARVFDPRTYLHQPYSPDSSRVPPIWSLLSDSGIQCGVIDFPYSYPIDGISGFKVADRGAHVPSGGGARMRVRTYPQDLEQEIIQLFGPDPANGFTSDDFPMANLKDVLTFRDTYVERIRNKTDLTLYLWRQRPQDFFMTVFTEAHCVGHRCWHIHDPTHPKHDPEIALAGDPIKDIYIALDGAVGRLIEAIGADARTLVYLSHGMGPRRSGTWLLDRILARLSNGTQTTNSSAVREVLKFLWRPVPGTVKRHLRPLRDRVSNDGFEPNRKKRRYFEVFANDRTGGIRINLAGREPHGVVRPEDYKRTCDSLISDLAEVVNDETGKPLVSEFIVTHDRYDGPYLYELPDILLNWDQSAPIHAASSDKIGRVDLQGLINPRTGDHRPTGRFFAIAPDWPAGQVNSRVRAEDFAPTIANLFGVAMKKTDGRAIPELVPRHSAAAD